jgi:rubrerythrin
MVIEAEKIGIGFYECLAESTRSAEARKVFTRIGEEEKEHVPQLERLSDAVADRRPTETYAEEYYQYLSALVGSRLFRDRRFCRQMARNTWDETAAAQLAASFEKEIILFLHEMRRFVPQAQQGTVDGLLEGEYEHLRRLHAMEQGQPPEGSDSR